MKLATQHNRRETMMTTTAQNPYEAHEDACWSVYGHAYDSPEVAKAIGDLDWSGLWPRAEWDHAEGTYTLTGGVVDNRDGYANLGDLVMVALDDVGPLHRVVDGCIVTE
jgi:hypothetical protein